MLVHCNVQMDWSIVKCLFEARLEDLVEDGDDDEDAKMDEIEDIIIEQGLDINNNNDYEEFFIN